MAHIQVARAQLAGTRGGRGGRKALEAALASSDNSDFVAFSDTRLPLRRAIMAVVGHAIYSFARCGVQKSVLLPHAYIGPKISNDIVAAQS